MAEVAEHVAHPILGSLGWLPEYGHWYAQPTLPSGVRIDLVVDPHNEDRFGFLAKAAELYLWALAPQRAILDQAVMSGLLKLCNGICRQEDLSKLDAAKLTDRMVWEFLKISASDILPINYGYDPGDLFGGRMVAVEMGAELRYRDWDLIG